MNRFVHELRRREVIRTAGLYVGICWIGIEGAGIVLPAFDAPDWILPALIIVALAGFPIMLVFAWIYDVSSRGIEVTPDATDTVVLPPGNSGADFVVIGVLSVALIFSVYLNITRSSGPAVTEEPPPVSILIADFQNLTGDPLFDGSLEQAMSLGIEGAPFITSFSRATALVRAQTITPGTALDEEAARLVATREGIQLVLSGAVRDDDGRLEFTVRVLDAETGEPVVEVAGVARDRGDALDTISRLEKRVREGLGDNALDEVSVTGAEAVTVATLAAAKVYAEAQFLAYEGDYEGAIDRYRVAIDEDPGFARAYSGWALAAFTLGRTTEAEELWEKALGFMDSMTERERLRTLGAYEIAVRRDYDKAIQIFETLVENYPADGAGHNNLAVAYFSVLDFDKAMQQGRSLLDLYPGNLLYQHNYALFAMYAGDFEIAESLGRQVVEADGSRFYSRLPLAIAELARGDLAAADAIYDDMASTGGAGKSIAMTGKADIALFSGDYVRAAEILGPAIEIDIAAQNSYGAAWKAIALAEALAGTGDASGAAAAADRALDLGGRTAQRVSAALLYLDAGDTDSASRISDDLLAQEQKQQRAYGHMLRGIMESRAGRHPNALEAFSEALDEADLWLVRYHLAQAYLAAGAAVEALDEFEKSRARIGEATAVFLDDMPTWRYTAELPYWRGRAQEELGMIVLAKASYSQYIASREPGGPLVADARERMAGPVN